MVGMCGARTFSAYLPIDTLDIPNELWLSSTFFNWRTDTNAVAAQHFFVSQLRGGAIVERLTSQNACHFFVPQTGTAVLKRG